ncbi:hypothetical protein BU26DRAFT_511476 [Trematosphaeria pertusa]|uniref:Uncharacterized protein n=1 Tax=Trematosphaeria pertusa TaxID=390896 RepID=A0A6A6HT74_9PLEO|nr:uncharacterized protein BU26DRAFT_511476 [Trematosphaeria pertusa]KAF2241375.1 hypothetical protein BU26DRAFT_511476 [Trematosphaeria pertusa]
MPPKQSGRARKQSSEPPEDTAPRKKRGRPPKIAGTFLAAGTSSKKSGVRRSARLNPESPHLPPRSPSAGAEEVQDADMLDVIDEEGEEAVSQSSPPTGGARANGNERSGLNLGGRFHETAFSGLSNEESEKGFTARACYSPENGNASDAEPEVADVVAYDTASVEDETDELLSDRFRRRTSTPLAFRTARLERKSTSVATRHTPVVSRMEAAAGGAVRGERQVVYISSGTETDTDTDTDMERESAVSSSYARKRRMEREEEALPRTDPAHPRCRLSRPPNATAELLARHRHPHRTGRPHAHEQQRRHVRVRRASHADAAAAREAGLAATRGDDNILLHCELSQSWRLDNILRPWRGEAHEASDRQRYRVGIQQVGVGAVRAGRCGAASGCRVWIWISCVATDAAEQRT